MRTTGKAWNRPASYAAALLLTGAALASCPALGQVGLLLSRSRSPVVVPAADVVLARDGLRTTLTVATTYGGKDLDLALVLPLASEPLPASVHAADPGLIERIAAVTAPRFVATLDKDPCETPQLRPEAPTAASLPDVRGALSAAHFGEGALTTELLTGKDAAAPAAWLKRHHYRLSPKARRALKPAPAVLVAIYRLAPAAAPRYLKPVQVAFDADVPSLPLAAGTVHLYALTRTGRVETRGLKTQRLPIDDQLPESVLSAPARVYDAFLVHQAQGRPAAFLEYAWDGTRCEPCVGDPLTPAEMRGLGAFWVDEQARPPKKTLRSAQAVPSARAQDVFLSRVAILLGAGGPGVQPLKATSDRNELQARFLIRRPYVGTDACNAASAYRASLPARHAAEAETLNRLTGWSPAEIQRELNVPPPAPLLPPPSGG